MTAAREREEPAPGRGTTSDPNQSNRRPAREECAEEPREAPVGPRPGGDGHDRDGA